MPAPIGLSVEQNQLAALAVRLSAEADGKRLRRELAAGLRAAVRPAVQEVKASAVSVKRSTSVAKSVARHKGPEAEVSLGAAVARGVGVQTRMQGKRAGVTVRASKKGMPRGFRNAPKRLNSKGWRHPVFGGKTWVDQVGKPDFFDEPLRHRKEEYRLACILVMESMASRIAK